MAQATGSAVQATFGPYRLDTATYELSRDGQPLRLRLQAARCLVWLVQHARQLVTREELRRELWSDDTFVNFDQGLNTCISDVRTALRDDAAAPRYVETLATRGYRFVAPVTWSAVEPATPSHETSSRPVPALPVPAHIDPHAPMLAPARQFRRTRAAWMVASTLALLTLALVLASQHAAPTPARLLVLPFRNLTGDAARDYLCDGLTEETITRLSGLAPARLAVIARTTAQALGSRPRRVAELAAELRVEYVLEGGLAVAGRRARMSVRLVQATDEAPLWSHAQEHDLDDLLDMQDSSARDIAAGVQSVLHLATPSTSMRPPRFVRPEAHEQVLIGRYRLSSARQPDPHTALAAFDAAIALQPDYAAAHAGRAAALSVMAAGEVPPKTVLPDAQAALERALQLDPQQRDAQLALANLRLFYAWDVAGAGRAFEVLLREHPGWAEAYHARAAWQAVRGHHADALRDVGSALELDPLSPVVNFDVGWYAYLARRPDEARRGYARALQLEPELTGVHLQTLFNDWVAGRWPEAVRDAQALVRASGRPEALARLSELPPEPALRRFMANRLRNLQGARERGQYLAEDNFYVGLALLGRSEEAWQSLERAAEERDYYLIANVAADPALDSLRADPRFRALRQRVGLDTER